MSKFFLSSHNTHLTSPKALIYKLIRDDILKFGDGAKEIKNLYDKRHRWRRWNCSIVILYVIGLQIILKYS